MTGVELIVAERKRQIEQEGWTAEHDEQHRQSELALAACYYAMPKAIKLQAKRETDFEIVIRPNALFPSAWHRKWAKRRTKDVVRRLAVAGALIAAEIDRIQALPWNWQIPKSADNSLDNITGGKDESAS